MEIWCILNLTDDSFYPESRVSGNDFLARAMWALENGAHRIDIGAESTRPFSDSVSPKEEWGRLQMPLAQLKSAMGPEDFFNRVSVDTTKATVAHKVLEMGVGCINDVSGAADTSLLRHVAEHNAEYVLMHTQGTPKTMQINPTYNDVTAEVMDFFREKVNVCTQAGISPSRIILDPGIGFGKTAEHGLTLISRAAELKKIGLRTLYGISRKSFLSVVLGIKDVSKRGTSSQVVHGWLISLGVDILRVHDLQDTLDTQKIISNLQSLLPREEKIAL